MQITTNKLPKIDDTCVIIKSPEGLLGTFTKFGDKVFEWCANNNVEADLISHWYDNGSFSAWKIANDKQRLLFTLRWSCTK